MVPRVVTDGIRYWLELDGMTFAVDWTPEDVTGPGQSGYVANIQQLESEDGLEPDGLEELARELDCRLDEAYEWLGEQLVEVYLRDHDGGGTLL